MDRGRVYECLTCNYKGERKAVLKHFRARHIQATERQYHCTLCNFSTDDQNMLKRHPNFFRPHHLQKEVMVAAGTYLGQDYLYIKVNENPRSVCEEKDIRRWEAAESALYWESRRKPSSHPPVPTVLPSSSTSSIASSSIASTDLQPSASSSPCATPSTETVRVVQDENVLDQLLYGTEEDDALFQMPEPLRSPPCNMPRPSLPDISLPVVEEPPAPSGSSTSVKQATLDKLLEVGMEMCQHLVNIEKQLKKNHDQMEKVEIAVRRSYSNNVTPRPHFNHRFRSNFHNSNFNNRIHYNRPSPSVNRRSPRKRKFIPENSLSPVKKVKSTIKKKK